MANADAASRLTGLFATTNNYSTRLRWKLAQSSRAACIYMAFKITGLSTGEDATDELHPGRMKRDRSDLQKITELSDILAVHSRAEYWFPTSYTISEQERSILKL